MDDIGVEMWKQCVQSRPEQRLWKNMERGKIIRNLEAKEKGFVCDRRVWDILRCSGTASEQWERGSSSGLCSI